MQKKVFLFSILIVSLIFVVPSLIADETQDKIDKAYGCLEEKIEDKCSSVSPEERIFSLLAIGECKSEVIDDSQDEKCWPKSNCKIKTTAQAILALDKANTDTSDAEEWLLSQNTTPSDIIWYLEIESIEATTCTITYSSSSYDINIGADKKINQRAGSCLGLSEGSWWLQISPPCYDKEFEISCDKGFLTTLLYQKPSSSTIYVSEDTNSASAGGTTTEKIKSFCFAQGTSCDYEGSLWAAMVLDYLDYDLSSYLPYLITKSSENEQYLPESFLYTITSDTVFRSTLLEKQMSNQYWKVSGDRFYDTALALFPFQYEELPEKTNSENWLLGIQDNEGCWQGNIRDTAFILYSIWPKEMSEPGGDEIDCEDAGYSCVLSEDCNGTVLDSDYVCPDENDICCDESGTSIKFDCEDEGYDCMSSMSCEEAGGDELENYDCFGVNVCCTKPKISNECVADLGGEICSSSDNCIGGNWEAASDLLYGEKCCVGGECETMSDLSECELYGGTCRISCNDGEEETSDECDYSGDVCCVEGTPPSEPTRWWIWVLLSLIVLVLLGIIFRDKLRTFWFRIKSKFGKSKPKGPGFFLPSRTPRTLMPRRILSPTTRQPARRPLPKKPKGELDEVLKKLKEMGK